MAKVLSISKTDSPEAIEKKIRDWSDNTSSHPKAFDASKFTGKIKSFGDGLSYQRKLRNEWD